MTYVYIVGPIILQHLKQNIRLLNFGQNWVQIAHLPQRRFFGNVDCYYYIPTVSFHATTVQKNPQRANNKTEVCTILPQTVCDLLSQKIISWKSDQHCFGLAIASHQAMSFQNICHRIDHEY